MCTVMSGAYLGRGRLIMRVALRVKEPIPLIPNLCVSVTLSQVNVNHGPNAFIYYIKDRIINPIK